MHGKRKHSQDHIFHDGKGRANPIGSYTFYLAIVMKLKERGVCQLNLYQKRTVYISIITLVFFFVLSVVSHNWGFFLWSIFSVYLVLMAVFSAKTNKQDHSN